VKNMKLESMNEKKNDFLKRKEITARLSFEKAIPSNPDVQTLIAGQLGVDKELVFVKQISSRFGVREADVTANVYESKENMVSLQKALQPKRDKAKSAEKKEEGK